MRPSSAIQVANVLNSPRAFVQLRELLASNKELARRFDQLEARLDKKLVEHDEAIGAEANHIYGMMSNPTADALRAIDAHTKPRADAE
jgi:hypothetical protein